MEKWTPLIGLLEKAITISAIVVGGLWIFWEYKTFKKEHNEMTLTISQNQVEQNKVSLQISEKQLERAQVERVLAERQATIHGLEITGKSAFRMQGQEELSINILSSPAPGGSDFRYLITWELLITNGGHRDVRITEHEIDIFLGTQQSPPGEFPSIIEVNNPGTDGLIHWVHKIHRKFSAEDLNRAALEPMSPGDTRFGGLSAIVHAPAGLWVYARTRLTIEGEPGEKAPQAYWKYMILPERNQEAFNKGIEPTR